MQFGPGSGFCRMGRTWASVDHPVIHDTLQVGCSEVPHFLSVEELKVHPEGQLEARQCRQ